MMDNEEDLKAKKNLRAQKRIRSQELADIRWLLGDKRGQRFLRRMFADCGILSISYANGDMSATCFNEGMKSLGLRYLKDVQEVNKAAFAVVLNDELGLKEALAEVDNFTNSNDEVESE